MPALSRVSQSLGVWGSKLIHGWPLIIRHAPGLVARFVLGRMSLR